MYGTPASDVAPADVKSSQKQASTTDRSVRTRPAPTVRWLLTTDNP